MFLIHKMDTSLSRGIEYIPKEGAGSGAVGMLLMPGGSYYVMVGASDMPTHLAIGTTNDAEIIPAIRIDPQIEFETVTEVDMTDVGLGAPLQVANDSVTATAGGHASLTYKEKLSDGTWLCRVRFI